MLENRSGIFRVLSQALNRSLTLREALDGAVPRIVELAGADAGWIFFHDAESGTTTLAADVNLPPALQVAGKRRMAGECRCIQMLREGRLTQAVNLIECARLEQALPDAPEKHQHATIPLMSQRDVPVGIMNLLLPPNRFLDDRDLNVLEALGNDVAVAIQRARLFETVRDQEAVTRELMQRLLATQEEERRRIAQDLHDHAGQTMTALIIHLDQARRHIDAMTKSTAMATLDKLHALAEQGYEEIRRLVYDLRPLILDEHGLNAAVRSYAETQLRPVGVEVDLKLIGTDDRLPRDVETAAYRIVQEATTNALKHAQAKRLEIRIDRRSEWLIVMVRDDGNGFDLEEGQPRKNLGLQGMRERAALVGGTVQVLSTLGVGTTIMARLPVLSGH
jgi:two-component system, NarL family, sensor kinase